MQLSFPIGVSNTDGKNKHVSFDERVRAEGCAPLAAAGMEVLQANLGFRCNMTCSHCHVSAGPGNAESMSPEIAGLVVSILLKNPFRVLDITGGAPELNPSFRFLVRAARKGGKHVVVRTNLTIFFEPGMNDLPEFYRQQGVELVASLPCYLERNVDAVRGSRTYAKSIQALGILNRHGFGTEEAGSLPLSLVYNPTGPFLPPPQTGLEADYKRELKSRFGISFTRLYAFANMPIGRFRQTLARRGQLEPYIAMLCSAFNPKTLGRIMCRNILSVGWDGSLSDCDFNQALGITVSSEGHRHIRDFDYGRLVGRRITTDDHCYGCTAGQGSS